jgi:hypothetical protein
MDNPFWIYVGVGAFAAWVVWRALRTFGMAPYRRRLTPRERRIAELRRKREEIEAVKAAQEREKERSGES